MGTTATARQAPEQETNYRFDLPESAVESLKAGIVTPLVQDFAVLALAWKDETHPIRRAYGTQMHEEKSVTR